MKFQCDRCKTRYSIADEKVRGKILKIRCKNCATVITVREEGAAIGRQEPSASGPILAAAAAPQPRAGATIELSAVAPPAPLAGSEPEPTQLQAALGPPPLDEWFISIDGEQEGPLTLLQARDRVSRKKPDEDIHAWREDFEAWLPVESVPALALFLPGGKKTPPPPPPRPSRSIAPLPPPVDARADLGAALTDGDAEDDPFAAVPGARLSSSPPAADDGMDFQIGEASRVVRMPQLGRLGDEVPPPAERPKPVPRGTGAARAINGAPRPDVSASVPFGASIAPEGRRSHTMIWVIGGLAVAALVVVLLVMSSGSSGSEAAEAEARKGSAFADDYYKNQKPEAPKPQPAVETPPAPVAETPKPKAPVARPKGPAAPTVAADKPKPPAPGGKEDTFVEETTGSGSLSPDDIRNAYVANQVVLMRCYERALKADPGLSVTKVMVTLTVAPSGIVDRVSIPQQSSALGSCLTQSIRSWRFRKTASEFTTEFPILFAKR
jgi:predicted Zn finger-like uncharacterized protein